MANDQRKTPRFVATDGVPARILLDDRSLNGTMHDFSSTGFAVSLEEETGGGAEAPIEVVFSTQNGQELKLSAVITNTRIQGIADIWLGCRITDMHHHAEAYFSFLTTIMSTQGFLRSMATKPVKARKPDPT